MKNRFNNFLLVLVFACLVLRSGLLGSVIVSHPDGVGALYWDVDARRYYTTAFLSSQGSSQFLNWDAPLFSGIVSVLFRIFSPDPAIPVFLNITIFFLSTGILFLAALSFLTKRQALWTVLLYVSYPSFFVYSLLPLPDPLFVLLVITTIYFFVQFLRSQRYVCAVGIGASTGLCILTKESAILLPILFIIALIAGASAKWRRAFCAGAIIIASCSFVVIPVAIYNKLSFHEFTVSGKMTKYFKFLDKVQRHALPDSVMKGQESLTAGITEVPATRHRLSWLTDYVLARRQFFFGTGTISLMRISGTDTVMLTKIPFSIRTYLGLLKEKGDSWVIFQIAALLLVLVVYFFAVVGFIKHIVCKHVAVATAFLCCIVYFLVAYFWNYNARHFTVLVPILSLLAGSAVAGASDEKSL